MTFVSFHRSMQHCSKLQIWNPAFWIQSWHTSNTSSRVWDGARGYYQLSFSSKDSDYRNLSQSFGNVLTVSTMFPVDDCSRKGDNSCSCSLNGTGIARVCASTMQRYLYMCHPIFVLFRYLLWIVESLNKNLKQSLILLPTI